MTKNLISFTKIILTKQFKVKSKAESVSNSNHISKATVLLYSIYCLVTVKCDILIDISVP